jgi:spermidine/putrescine transport system substrate-binding protein
MPDSGDARLRRYGPGEGERWHRFVPNFNQVECGHSELPVAVLPPARGISRRALLTLFGAAALAGCSAGSDSTAGRPRSSRSPSASATASGSADKTLTWSNWPNYIDVRKKAPKHPTLAAFTAQTGVQVDYREVIEDNASYVATINTALREHRPVDTDLMVLTSWMSARLVGAREVQQLDLALMPTATKNLIGALANPSWDPGRRYSMPWQAGLTGIAYDATKVDRAIGSISELLTRKDLAGRVSLLTEFNDTVGAAALVGGADLTDLTVADVEKALDIIRTSQSSGQVRHFYGNEFIKALKSGTVAACLAWSGDVLQAQLTNPNIKFVAPEEGLLIWSDDFLVPTASVHGTQAAHLINWFYQPEVAAKVAAWVNYICPVAGAQEEMVKIDPDLALSPLIFPDSTTLDRSFQFPVLPSPDDSRLRSLFAGIVGKA